MARRELTVDGQRWEVFPSGRPTVYGQDQYGLVFQLGTGAERKRRFTRYAPTGARLLRAFTTDDAGAGERRPRLLDCDGVVHLDPDPAGRKPARDIEPG